MIVFGTMTFGGQTDEAEARRIVDAAIDAGITHFDTANIYTKGASEEILGRCLKGRQGVTVASKVGCKSVSDAQGLKREQILKNCDESLRRLGMERIDLYYMHQPDWDTPLEESLEAMESLVKAGKIARVGASNFAAWQMMRMLGIVSVVQPMYNLIARDIERELLPMCRHYALEVLVYNPLAGGLLTGKHRPGTPAEKTRFDKNDLYLKRYWHDPMFRAVEELSGIASKAGKTLLELSLQWVASRDVGIILGASRLEQFRECLAALDGKLDEATLRACDEVYDRLHGPIPKYNR